LTLDQFTPDSRALTLIMAQLLSVMLALSPSLLVAGQDVLGLGEVKHVMAGEEYNVRQLSKGAREPKSNGLCSKVPADKYKNCAPQGEDNRTFYDYHSEDIEKLTNVSFSEPKYQGKVLMVVNLASF